jgi:hypothetical protein
VVERASDLIARWDGLSLQLSRGDEIAPPDPWPFEHDLVEAHVDARDLLHGGWRTIEVSLERA